MIKKIFALLTLLAIGNHMLAQCTDSYATITVEVCGNYISPSGLYTWEVSDTYMDTIPNIAGCDSILTIDLTINPLPVISFISDILFGCAPSTVHFSVFADVEVDSYEWNFGDGDILTDFDAATSHYYTESGLYDVTLTALSADGCIDSVRYADYISIYASPTISFGAEDIETCDDVYLLDAGPGFGAYSWSTGETTQTIEVDVTGDFWVVVYDLSFTCSNRDTINVLFKDCSAIEDIDLAAVNVFPNPVSTHLTFTGIPAETQISVFSIYGRLIDSHVAINKNYILDMSRYTDGSYYIRLDSDSNTTVKRIIKQAN